MKNRMVLALLLGMTAIFCSSQSFLSKYPKLTKKNLNEFFLDWEIYSDSIASNNNTIKDSVLADVIRHEYAEFLRENCNNPNGVTPRYYVLPQSIEVGRYYSDMDTVMARLEFAFPPHMPDMKGNQYVVDSITPILPQRGMYLTADIYKMLSTFVGGLKKGDKITEINKRNVRRLGKYIPVDYGHWGGYWWFVSFPLITDICYSNNLIAVMRRTSWWTGDVIWYVKENDKFVRRQQPVTTWVE